MGKSVAKWAILSAAIALLTVSCSKSTTTTATSPSPTVASPTVASPAATAATPRTVGDVTFSVTAADQSGNGKSIIISSVTLGDPAGGYVAIHADSAGAPGPVLGVSALLPKGTSTDVSVPFTNAVTTTAVSVWPMVHVEDNADGRYDFPGHDAPAKASGKIVMVNVTETVK